MINIKMVKSGVFILLMVCLCGCNNVSGADDSVETDFEQITEKETEEHMELTVEYLCEKFGIERQEFSDIDFQDFINHFGLTREKIDREDVAFLLRLYREEAGREPMKDYAEICKRENKITPTEETLSGLVTVIFEHAYEEVIRTIVIDFEEGKSYRGNYPVSLIDDNTESAPVDENHKEEILSLFGELGAYDWWGVTYNQDSEALSQRLQQLQQSWKLTLLYEDGSISSLWGVELAGEYAPEGLESFIQALEGDI